jgi:hypothetical protein
MTSLILIVVLLCWLYSSPHGIQNSPKDLLVLVVLFSRYPAIEKMHQGHSAAGLFLQRERDVAKPEVVQRLADVTGHAASRDRLLACGIAAVQQFLDLPVHGLSRHDRHGSALGGNVGHSQGEVLCTWKPYTGVSLLFPIFRHGKNEVIVSNLLPAGRTLRKCGTASIACLLLRAGL